MSRAIAWTVAIVATLAGCAGSDEAREAAASSPNRQCFFAASAMSFAASDTRTVNVRVGANQFFRLDLMSPCRDVTWATTRMTLSGRGSTSICTGPALGTTLVTRGPSGQRRCTVRTITALTQQDVDALASRARP